MKPMNYKNSDLGMWHHFADVAEQLQFVAKAEEDKLIGLCVHYHWDDEAFEEECNCESITRKKDFDSRKECWKCPSYSVQDESNKEKTT